MYLRFFGLQHEPFSIAPDPRFLFMSERHREALAHLRFGLGGGGGFVVLTGEIGAGKTTVCRCLLEQIPRNCSLAYLFNPKLTVRELLQSVCADFGIPNPRAEANTASIKDYIDALNAHLLRSHAAGQHNVLIIDEAQSLSADVLEQLRLLTNLETNERKLLQIVLIGQPELRTMLARPELEQLAQRVVARFHLGTLAPAETEQYIHHRLAVAGMTSRNPFDAQARKRIHQLAGGVPRRINLLCDRALLGAYAEGTRRVRRPIVDKAAREVFDGRGAPGRRPFAGQRQLLWGLGLAGGAAAAAGIVLAWKLWPGNGSGAAALPAIAASAASAAAPAVADAKAPNAPSTLPELAAASTVPVAAAASAAMAASAAAGAAPLAAVPWLNGADLANALRSVTRDEAQAWRDLAPAWKLAALVGDPCLAAREQQVQCLKRRGTLELLRQLDRPAILPLYGADGQARFAQLVGLSDIGVTLRLGEQLVRLAPDTLSSLWRGELGTYWRVPAGVRVDPAGINAAAGASWLAAQLGRANRANVAIGASGATGVDAPIPTSADAVRSAVRAFQRANGLQADGVAGPATLMTLNRAVGVDEPRLQH